MLHLLNPSDFVEFIFAGLWAEVWKYGTATGLLILLGLGAWFSPVGKTHFVWAAVVLAVGMGVYSYGVRDESGRCKAQITVLKKHIPAPPKPKSDLFDWFPH